MKARSLDGNGKDLEAWDGQGHCKERLVGHSRVQRLTPECEREREALPGGEHQGRV